MSCTTPHYYPKYEILWNDDNLANGPFNGQKFLKKGFTIKQSLQVVERKSHWPLAGMGWLSRQIVPLNKIIPVLPLVWKNFDIRLFVIIIFVIWLKFTVKFKVLKFNTSKLSIVQVQVFNKFVLRVQTMYCRCIGKFTYRIKNRKFKCHGI